MTHQCHCHRINHECHEHPAQTQLKYLSLTVKLIDHNSEIWTVIKHEPEVQRVKLRKEGPGMHPEWDAPEWTPVTLENTPQGPIWRLHDEQLDRPCPRPTAQNEAMSCLRFAGDLVRAQQPEAALPWIDKAREIVGGMVWRQEAEP